MTTSDIIASLVESDEDLDRLEFIVIKHWDGGKFDERIYAGDFDSFVNLIFDLDVHGWELSGFGKSKLPVCPDSYSFYVKRVYAEFARTKNLE